MAPKHAIDRPQLRTGNWELPLAFRCLDPSRMLG